MITIETSHFPAADDITLDSLEYLFSPAPAVKSTPVPWVEIISDPVLYPAQTAELQSKVEVLEQESKDNLSQLQRVCILLGYTQGLLHERDEQLKVLPDLRFKAAQSVALGLEAERYKEKVAELEEVIARLEERSDLKTEEILKTTQDFSADETATSILMWTGLVGLTGILWTLLGTF